MIQILPSFLFIQHFKQNRLRWMGAVVCGLHSLVSYAGDVNYLPQLIQQSQNQHLSSTAQWHRLLHYRQSWLGGMQSEVDDPAFFIASDGKYDPQHELEATLRAFFSTVNWGEKSESAQCAFHARFEWLNQRLHFDSTRLPKQDCNAFDRWYRGINPDSLTLIFPSAYLNNPSSMFGHTLLRVDSAAQNESTRLLSYAINYGANTGKDNGVAFAFKGIFGGYHGTAGIGPYYLKVKEYSDSESRDIWEYRLNMSHDEIRRLLAHVWELRGVYFDYYFFDENCSYFILALLDVARPELDLSAKLRGWVIPSDTLRVVTQQPGLLQQVVYRPSAGTRLGHLATQLAKSDQNEALELANGKRLVSNYLDSRLVPQVKADTILLAHDYLRYEFLAGRRERETSLQLARQLLQARSTINQALPNPPVPTPDVSPEQGHATGMIQLGAGRAASENFVQIEFRPAYHDLLDNDDGYIEGAQINFLRTSIRYYSQAEKTEINEFTLVDIISLSPRDQFFSPISWRIKTGWERLGVDRSLSFRINGGAGMAGHANEQSLIFAMLDLGINSRNQFEDSVSAAYGLEFGAIWQPMPRWKLLLRVEGMQYYKNADYHYANLQLGQRISISKQYALDVQFERYQALGINTNSFNVAWRWYL